MITESDWKKFKIIKAKALEKFSGEILCECQQAITEKEATNHSKYLALYELIDKRDKKLAEIFDGHSRSKASLQLILMRLEGLVENGDLQGLSEGFQESTKPNRW